MTHDQTETLLDLLTDIKVEIGEIAKSLEEVKWNHLTATNRETVDADAV